MGCLTEPLPACRVHLDQLTPWPRVGVFWVGPSRDSRTATDGSFIRLHRRCGRTASAALSAQRAVEKVVVRKRLRASQVLAFFQVAAVPHRHGGLCHGAARQVLRGCEGSIRTEGEALACPLQAPSVRFLILNNGMAESAHCIMILLQTSHLAEPLSRAGDSEITS